MTNLTYKTNQYRKNAFTLLETLVALSIIGIIAAFSINFLATVIKDGAKATVISEIKQNGNYALDVMSYYIRNASSVEDCSAGDSITIKNGTDSIVFDLLPQDVVNNLNARIASNSTILTNAEKNVGVDVAQLAFSCDLTRTPPLVSITLQIKQSKWITRPESSATVDFQTNISLRSY
ncbi:type II secretion system protein [Candidatus Microgenomates bacterium]|nr:type II secretion system protein [Candidatus Microgenomates bacterium]